MKSIKARLVNLMKSCFAGWNPSELGWNLRCATSDEIKSAPHHPALAGFHRVAISSTKWIYSDAGGFNWKRLRIVSNPESFSGADDGIWTHTNLFTGTWNQRVCRSATSAYQIKNWKLKIESYLAVLIILTKIFSISTQSFNMESVSASVR